MRYFNFISHTFWNFLNHNNYKLGRSFSCSCEMGLIKISKVEVEKLKKALIYYLLFDLLGHEFQTISTPQHARRAFQGLILSKKSSMLMLQQKENVTIYLNKNSYVTKLSLKFFLSAFQDKLRPPQYPPLPVHP